jgi:hypothetical protein
MKTKEEILDKHIGEIRASQQAEIWYCDAIKAMEEYAEEYHCQHSANTPVMLSLPSDEEADKAAIRFGTLEDSNGNKIENSDMVYGFIEAYNWMKEWIFKRS